MRYLMIRRCLLMSALMLLPCIASAQWAFIQEAHDTPGGSDTTVAATTASTGTSGSLLVACVVVQGTTIDGVSDPTNGSWTEYTTGSPVSGANTLAAFYFENNANTGTIAVTATYGASGSNRGILVLEYSGIATSSAFDVSAGQAQTNPGTGTDDVSSGNTANTSTNDSLIVTCANHNNQGASADLTEGTGFTGRVDDNDGARSVFAADDNLDTAGGATAGTWTAANTTQDTETLVGVFAPAGGGGGPSAGTLHYYRSNQ